MKSALNIFICFLPSYVFAFIRFLPFYFLKFYKNKKTHS
ncbi:MAG: hypothetical protein HSCHL_0047 [Hydrogenibacillus schlegelii]|uniref:Uncharacterized protein n=1 Tax=Hydrogenibacillus schlegelii TaxID=1484 RepID=A0A2T5G3J1_HYDSH|nr:MAG: hypothetical protein HSCHL_0047 [Hydrogenibacillus schlegelii]